MADTKQLVTQRDLEILNSKDDQTLAEWYCMMNVWKWPEDLPGEPDEAENAWRRPTRRSALMDMIEARIDHRLIARTWNQDMSDEVFNDFYAGTYEGDQVARKRYDRWAAATLKS